MPCNLICILVAFEMASVEELLEARPILSNRELLAFHFPSRNIVWKDLISPISRRGVERNLGRNFKHLSSQEHTSSLERTDLVVQKVLVCHDLKGNYREDRRYSSSKKWDDYRFYHWAGIDYFCYFSHYYVTIPPAGWINAAHKHGVIMLGTFIVEGGNCHLISEIMGSRQLINETVDALVHLCDHFCFEGYLLNIECSIHRNLISNLEYFVELLTKRIHDRIPHGTIIWYDSVTHSGSLSHQNELNYKNKQFFESTDGILINYHWSDDCLLRSANLIRGLFPGQESKVFVGIDIFGRSQPAKFDTHKLLERIVPFRFSVGLFAIGWAFEHLKEYYNLETYEGDELLNDAFLTNNDSFWELLWQYFPTKPYTELPFYSNLCLGSGKYQFGYGNKDETAFLNLSKQALQPSVPLYGLCDRSFNESLNGGSCLSIKKTNEIIRLFCTDFQITESFILAFASKIIHASATMELVMQISVRGERYEKFHIVLGSSKVSSVIDNQIFLQQVEENQTYKVAEYLTRNFIQLRLPFTLANEWKAHYFLAKFSKPVHVTDIGVVVRAPVQTQAYLGAVHFHAGSVRVDDLPIIEFSEYDG